MFGGGENIEKGNDTDVHIFSVGLLMDHFCDQYWTTYNRQRVVPTKPWIEFYSLP